MVYFTQNSYSLKFLSRKPSLSDFMTGALAKNTRLFKLNNPLFIANHSLPIYTKRQTANTRLCLIDNKNLLTDTELFNDSSVSFNILLLKIA